MVLTKGVGHILHEVYTNKVCKCVCTWGHGVEVACTRGHSAEVVLFSLRTLCHMYIPAPYGGPSGEPPPYSSGGVAPPPQMSPPGSGQSMFVQCRVCQNIIHVSSGTQNRVVKCTSCSEATVSGGVGGGA